MRCLEWIIAANEQETISLDQTGLGWEVKLGSEILASPLACPGIVHVFNKISGEHFTVDVSNPHDETELIEFHRNWDGPASVKARVEAFASQHRRMVCRAA